MTLTDFITSLQTTGDVIVAPEILDFTQSDQESAGEILLKIYDQESRELPGIAPNFQPAAALWAAQHIYRAVQLSMMRNIGNTEIARLLAPYSEEKNAESIFSADLSLRQLPEIINLAKGLAPNDPLVKALQKTAHSWPLSSVGVEFTPPIPETDQPIVLPKPNLDKILAHKTLAKFYADRIISKKVKHLLQTQALNELIRERLGNYAETIWPEITDLIYPEKENKAQ